MNPKGVPPGFTNFMRGSANYIKRLVEARKNFADALVYGAQLDQPTTEAGPEGSRRLVAYGYAGTQRNVITIVNTDAAPAQIGLNASSVLHSGDVFCDAVSGEQFVVSTLPLQVAVPPAPETCVHDDASRPVCGLRVLVRKGPNEICA